jgi:hypothetical protein
LLQITILRNINIKNKISEIPQDGQKLMMQCFSNLIKNAVQSPLMLKKEGKDQLYVNVAEAAVLDYPASHLEVDAQNFKFKTHLTADRQGAKGYIQTPTVTPWRTIIVAPKAEEVMDSKMMFNLNEPTKYKDTSYIQTYKIYGCLVGNDHRKITMGIFYAENVHIGKTDFSKLTPNGKHAANNTKVKEYIDLQQQTVSKVYY